ncbi:Elongator complex protein [Apophysomyces sp. BC1034]|nr:Elongator complex protein [Apophysomyces sp. BC1015]KAG0174953.1 Elongator complex protein [Apophysomyces sp. BC1021]KAG0185928.1 Elongator complex protein [Apophysomyces sp. BC1034]
MASLCLDQLLNNRKSAPFILLNDTIKLSALTLLTEFGARALDEDHTLIVVLTESSPAAWFDRLKHSKNMNSYIIDAYTDPLGWDEPISKKDIHVVRDINDMERSILAPIIKKTQDTVRCTILIDSLSCFTMVSQQRTYQMMKALESLTTDSIRLVAVQHTDVRPPSSIGSPMIPDALNRLASVVITVEALKERTYYESQALLTGFVPQETFSYLTTTSNLITRGGLAKIEWRRKSGKVQYETNGFYLEGDSLVVVPVEQLTGMETKTAADINETEEEKPDIMSNLSFNLSLTDEQRKAKENIVLPYIKAQHTIEVEKEKSNSGNIYYEPDAADDFDDEDPDDDLDL